MVNTLAYDVHAMVDDQPIVLPELGQEMHELTLWPQPPAAGPRPQTEEPCPQPRTPETHPVSGLQCLGLLMPQNPRSAVPTQREAKAARNPSDVDVEEQLLG